jgi:zinc/manganese transport system substrate-binding protein
MIIGRVPGVRKVLVMLLAAAAAALCAGCGFDGPSTGAVAPGTLRVVAAENVWGSIAAQLGGARVHVTSIVSSPSVDPHAYEPTAADARAFADAQLVIVNGIGYDPWASRLVSANPVDGRIALDVGALVGIDPGGNPHRWYSPADVRRVVAAIAAAYTKLDAKHASYFTQRKARFETRALAPYTHAIAEIRRAYRGVPVGASESIFEPLASALGLRLITPPSFLKAISEGTEPTAADKKTIDRQVASRAIKVWVYNSQNTTPDVDRITDAARANGIPVTTVTETLAPPTASFQSWQVRQLTALALALRRATSR